MLPNANFRNSNSQKEWIKFESRGTTVKNIYTYVGKPTKILNFEIFIYRFSGIKGLTRCYIMEAQVARNMENIYGKEIVSCNVIKWSICSIYVSSYMHVITIKGFLQSIKGRIVTLYEEVKELQKSVQEW